MKTIATLLSLFVIACGSQMPSASQTSSADHDAASKKGGTVTAQALSSDRAEAISQAFATLDGSVISNTAIDAFASDALFASVDVTPALKAVGFTGTQTLLVPAGYANAPADPDQSDEFYLQIGATTNTAGGNYGPFVITSNGYGMVEANADAVVTAATALDASAFTSAVSLAGDAVYANLNATPTEQSASFGQSMTVLVPAGNTGSVTDPDLASSYFIVLGSSTNRAGGTFGPFPLQ